jgi:hypothetical protein
MSLVWLYAVRGAAAAAPTRTGVDGEEPRLVVHGELAAVVGTVSEQGFDEQALAAAMDDLPRIERLARAHHGVIAEAAEAGPVAPLRLATVYRDDAAVALERVRGRREWGVKVYVDAKAEAPAAEPAAEDRPGTSYLLRRRAQRDRGVAAAERARRVADTLDAALAAVAQSAIRLKIQDARLSGRTQDMVLNATYLVDTAAEEDFRAVLAGIEGDGATVAVTGPWPPFSFAEAP